MKWLVIALVAACSADPKPVAPEPRPTAAPGPVRFYCANGTCILATKGGTDAFAKRHTERCARGCEEREGAWCFAAAPASNADNPFKGEKMTCFADEASCKPPTGVASILCAPMSASIALLELELEDRNPARADPITIDYHCSDVTSISGENCFDSLWSCAFRRYQMISASSPCRRVERVWCYAAAMPKLGLHDPIEDCRSSPEQCEVARRGRDNANATPCTMKANPTR